MQQRGLTPEKMLLEICTASEPAKKKSYHSNIVPRDEANITRFSTFIGFRLRAGPSAYFRIAYPFHVSIYRFHARLYNPPWPLRKMRNDFIRGCRHCHRRVLCAAV